MLQVTGLNVVLNSARKLGKAWLMKALNRTCHPHLCSGDQDVEHRGWLRQEVQETVAWHPGNHESTSGH